MALPTIYFIRDPETGSMEQLLDFDADALDAAQDRGCEFVAIDQSGRCTVAASDVMPPDDVFEQIVLVGPSHVAVRMQAVVDVFDALDALLCHDAGVAASQDADAAFRAAPRVLDAAARFREKLAALKGLALAGEAGDGE